MGKYSILQMFENPRTGRQARHFRTNVPKILDLKRSSEQIFSENWRWVPLLCHSLAALYRTRRKRWYLNFDTKLGLNWMIAYHWWKTTFFLQLHTNNNKAVVVQGLQSDQKEPAIIMSTLIDIAHARHACGDLAHFFALRGNALDPIWPRECRQRCSAMWSRALGVMNMSITS